MRFLHWRLPNDQTLIQPQPRCNSREWKEGILRIGRSCLFSDIAVLQGKAAPNHYFCRKVDCGKSDAASERQTLRQPRAAYGLPLVRHGENDGGGMHLASAGSANGDGVVAERGLRTHGNVHGG